MVSWDMLSGLSRLIWYWKSEAALCSGLTGGYSLTVSHHRSQFWDQSQTYQGETPWAAQPTGCAGLSGLPWRWCCRAGVRPGWETAGCWWRCRWSEHSLTTRSVWSEPARKMRPQVTSGWQKANRLTTRGWIQIKARLVKITFIRYFSYSNSLVLKHRKQL